MSNRKDMTVGELLNMLCVLPLNYRVGYFRYSAVSSKMVFVPVNRVEAETEVRGIIGLEFGKPEPIGS